MKNDTEISRRRFTSTLLKGAALAPLAGLIKTTAVQAQDLPHVELDDPVAAALKYVHDAANAERPEKQGVPGAEQVCTNCQFVQGNDGDEWRPCMLFPGKAVSARGWCASWTKKA